MRAMALLALLVSATGCTHMPWSRSSRAEGIESIYWRAVQQLDTASTAAGVESARALLDGYLTAEQRREHVAEATVLRRLATASLQLTRVEASLRANPRPAETAPASAETKRAEPEPRRDEEALKEIQRLKDELAKANAELERIRKRLANPKEPTG
jgi:hypothetical protein